MSKDRRFDNRYNISLPADIISEFEEMKGRIKDISLNGIGIESEGKFEIGQKINFRYKDEYVYLGEIHAKELTGALTIKHIEKTEHGYVCGGLVSSAAYRDYVEEKEIMNAVNKFSGKEYEK